MAEEYLGHGMTEHEYVEYMLDVKNGQVVACELSGEGRQVEPLTKPVLLKPLEGEPWANMRGWHRLERRVRRALRKITRS